MGNINNVSNPELLKAFLEPLVREMVDERVNERLSNFSVKTEPERPILIEEAARMLGYSVSHIYTLCRTKKIPHVKKGRWLHFYVSELNEWLREGK